MSGARLAFDLEQLVRDGKITLAAARVQEQILKQKFAALREAQPPKPKRGKPGPASLELLVRAVYQELLRDGTCRPGMRMQAVYKQIQKRLAEHHGISTPISDKSFHRYGIKKNMA